MKMKIGIGVKMGSGENGVISGEAAKAAAKRRQMAAKI
jgi:hypothetical protein